MTYTVSYDFNGAVIINRSDGLSFGVNPNNPDYQAFLIWNAAQQAPLSLTNVAPFAIVPRSMMAIASAIFGLSSTQKANIITNLFGGSTPLYFSDTGRNAAALSSCYVGAVNSSGVATFNQIQQLVMAAMYTQDNPSYLVNPAFDPTINIPGNQVI